MDNKQKVTDLHKQIKQINKEIRILEENTGKLYDAIRLIMKSESECYSCGHHNFKENMWIADQEDIDNWIDNEGYAEPAIGEYYCGC